MLQKTQRAKQFVVGLHVDKLEKCLSDTLDSWLTYPSPTGKVQEEKLAQSHTPKKTQHMRRAPRRVPDQREAVDNVSNDQDQDSNPSNVEPRRLRIENRQQPCYLRDYQQ